MMTHAQETAPQVSIKRLSEVLAIPRSAFYYQPKKKDTPLLKSTSARALSEDERSIVLGYLNSERFVDRAPQEVYGCLLDEGTYLCSIRTMYRILSEAGEVQERRAQRRHPNYTKPELLAQAPNQLWTWDITQLKGPCPGTFYYLYSILDVYSRYVVGWMVTERQLAEHSEHLLRETYHKYQLHPEPLVIHSDNGKQMNAKNVSQLLAGLGVVQSFSRPHVSDDNPYSESSFKTLKYHPSFPERFGCLEDAMIFCRQFYGWYNEDHRHTGLNLLTPADVHFGRAPQIIEKRQDVLNKAYSNHPERFGKGSSTHPPLPKEVWINKPSGLANDTVGVDKNEKRH